MVRVSMHVLGTREGKRSSPAYLENWPTGPARFLADKETQYLIRFKVEKDFGIPGAILVENNHSYEFLLKEIKLELQNGSQSITFTCNSWVYKPTIAGDRRIFFSNKVSLYCRLHIYLELIHKVSLYLLLSTSWYFIITIFAFYVFVDILHMHLKSILKGDASFETWFNTPFFLNFFYWSMSMGTPLLWQN